MGYIIKNCPMKKKEHVEGTKKLGNIGETATLENKEIMTAKPTVSLKYPEWIHFSTKCRVKGTDQGHWDDILKHATWKQQTKKGKEKIEHFGIKLEDIKGESDSHFQPIQPNIKRSLTLNKDIQGVIKRPTNSEPIDKEDTNSSSSDDFTIITLKNESARKED
nr:hypothetical protein [Tanacetum cinerariifolium]